jgi:hypothetical protein
MGHLQCYISERGKDIVPPIYRILGKYIWRSTWYNWKPIEKKILRSMQSKSNLMMWAGRENRLLVAHLQVIIHGDLII